MTPPLSVPNSRLLGPIPFHDDVIEVEQIDASTGVEYVKRCCENVGANYASPYAKMVKEPSATVVMVQTVGAD